MLARFPTLRKRALNIGSAFSLRWINLSNAANTRLTRPLGLPR
jgi:hypothetical protein